MKKLEYGNYYIVTDEDIFSVIRDFILKEINSCLSSQPFFSLALSGGSTPVKLYRLLAREKLPWERVKIFPVDERVLPEGIEGLNWKMIEEEFLNNLSLKPSVFPPEGLYFNPSGACFKMEDNLKKELPEGQNGIPVIDLILLGTGSDGHTASLFYERGAFYETEKLVTLTDAPGPFEERMTFTFPLINEAGKRWFLVAGKDKKDMLRNIFTVPECDFPAAKVARIYPSVWFLDSMCLPELDYMPGNFMIS